MNRASRRVTRATFVAAGWLVVALGLGACDGAIDTAGRSGPLVIQTVPLGELPEPLPRAEPSTPPNLDPTTTTEPPPPTIEGPIGQIVEGNRVLVIGDGVFAETAPRNGGILCDVLVDDFGWTVEIAAEPGRDIAFGAVVLDERLDPAGGEDWDVAIVMLGNLFDGDLDAFERELVALLDRLAPRPTVVFTLSEVDDEAELNDLIRREAERPNVAIVDWAELTAAEPGVLLRDNGPLPTDEGSGRLVIFMAGALGRAPVPEGETTTTIDDAVPDLDDAPAGTGECLPTVFDGSGTAG